MVKVPLTPVSYSQSQDREAYNNPEKWFGRFRWLKHALRRRKKTLKSHIKFLTLPGVECFDVRLFTMHGLLKTTATGFDPISLAYCEEIPERYARIGNLLPNARRFNGSYEDFIGVGRAGFTNMADRWFPFDVINLDFSGPGFYQPGRSTSTTAEALSKTFQLQKSKLSSFSLFLTLPADPTKNDLSGKRQLDNCLTANLTDTGLQDFSRHFSLKYPRVQLGSSPIFQSMPYNEFLLLTVPKLVIKYGLNEWFTVSCEEKLTYIGEGHTTQMVSFCFDCEYVGLPTGYGGRPQTPLLQQKYTENTLDILLKSNANINQLFGSYPRLREKYRQIRNEVRKYYGTRLQTLP